MTTMGICFTDLHLFINEVWLSEPERQDCREVLEQQQCRHDAHERRHVSDSLKEILKSPAELPPGLVVSDDEASVDEASDGDPLADAVTSGSQRELILAYRSSITTG